MFLEGDHSQEDCEMHLMSDTIEWKIDAGEDEVRHECHQADEGEPGLAY